jgi:hypothetical protein
MDLQDVSIGAWFHEDGGRISYFMHMVMVMGLA